LPIQSATLAVRQTMVELISEQVARGLWKGVTLRDIR